MTLPRSPVSAHAPGTPVDAPDSDTVATLAELTRQNTSLSREEVGHLQRLVSEWGMLADFCFADMLLYVPADGPGPLTRWLVVGQVRPATAQTLYISDWVGTWANDSERPLLALQDEPGLREALRSEEDAEREADQRYWAPLKQELEKLTHHDDLSLIARSFAPSRLAEG